MPGWPPAARRPALAAATSGSGPATGRSVAAACQRTPATPRSPRDQCRANTTPHPRGSPELGRVRLRCLSFGPDRGGRNRWSTHYSCRWRASACVLFRWSSPIVPHRRRRRIAALRSVLRMRDTPRPARSRCDQVTSHAVLIGWRAVPRRHGELPGEAPWRSAASRCC